MSKGRHNDPILKLLGNDSLFLKDVWRLISICLFAWLWKSNICSIGRIHIRCSLKLLLSKN